MYCNSLEACPLMIGAHSASGYLFMQNAYKFIIAYPDFFVNINISKTRRNIQKKSYPERLSGYQAVKTGCDESRVGSVALDVQKAYPAVIVGRERTVKGVVAVRRYKIASARIAADEQCVIIIALLASELYDVSDLKSARSDLGGERTDAVADHSLGLRVVGEEIVEELNSRPGSRPVVGRYVVPAEYRSEIHPAAARKQALGHKVRAVPASSGEIIEQRIS